ncbi:tyrosine-type recombinase/integrase (plasmid) [Lichenicola cladoniae]|uniref:Tyrosine-type recombinase/integrase n=1 Tax=Lichenicola cladoniae TaxID=1484109 RepID=A0A6M8HYB5_9PROT|nr:tyrosine-type recombinase/integrase [Lichenicola cladoniae]NPD66289.1 tyrosine-type recombinase/integrase [Acetobacteraceae bacterium]QKE93177.1 tyrosine-type recombinase/integrase [Lichenicola cladoniae]
MLSDQISRYVALHRNLGRKFADQERMLQLFAKYAEAFGDQHVVAIRLYDWCSKAPTQNAARNRFDMVRRFSLYAHSEDQGHQIPASGMFGQGRRPRPTPHIIEPEQLRAIMQAALNFPSKELITPYTYYYLFGLLAASGLRISEALAIQRNDLVDDGLIIRNGKFGKQRLLPLQDSTRQALITYLAIKGRLGAEGENLFVRARGRAPDRSRVCSVFIRLARMLGFRGPTGTRGIRLHDLRHTFAVRSLESCPCNREAISHHMVGLSAYLGHADIANTYWYLEATPILLREIATVGEKLFIGGLV